MTGLMNGPYLSCVTLSLIGGKKPFETPEQVAACKASHTGKYLAELLSSRSNLPRARWEIDSDDLGPVLEYVQDKPPHGVVAARVPMTLAELEQALAATRARWVRMIG